jgi:hypothetical protein
MEDFSPSTTFLGKLTNEVGDCFVILPPAMKRPETLTEYVKRHMKRLNLNQTDVEVRARREARRRGVEQDYKISDATVGNIVNEKHGSLGVKTLIALAWALDQPIEDVVAVAFQLEAREEQFSKSEFFRLWNLHQQITAEDDRSYFARQISSLVSEMETAIKNAPKKSRRSSG